MAKPKNKIPKKGYYLCALKCNNLGTVRTAVKITRGRIVDYMGTKQDQSLLSNFSHLPTHIYVKYFAADATHELIALRRRVAKLERSLT